MQVYYLRHNISSKMKYSRHLDINAYMPLDLHRGGDFKTYIMYIGMFYFDRGRIPATTLKFTSEYSLSSVTPPVIKMSSHFLSFLSPTPSPPVYLNIR